MFVNCLNRIVLFFIMGMVVLGLMLLSLRIVELLVMIVIILCCEVSVKILFGFWVIDW